MCEMIVAPAFFRYARLASPLAIPCANGAAMPKAYWVTTYRSISEGLD